MKDLLSSVRAIVVTDAPDEVAPIARALRAEGASVRISGAATEIWAALGETRTDIVILALYGGAAPEPILRALASEEKAGHLRVIVSTPPETFEAVLEAASPLAPVVLSESVAVERIVSACKPLAALAAERDGWASRSRMLEEQIDLQRSREAVYRADLGSLSHDVRALLNVIVGYGANLRDEIAGPVTDEQRKHAERIVGAANDASALLDAPAPSRPLPPVADPTALKPAPRLAQRSIVRFGELARQTSDLFAEAAKERRVDVVTDADPSIHIFGNAMQLKQVITNLIVNAIKYTPEGGQVQVSVRRASPVSAGAGQALRAKAQLVISDTGPGVPPAERERIFERGARLASHAELPGSGIGLSVVREIVSSHRGNVRVEDAAGGGAAFVVELPLDLRRRQPSSMLVLRDGDPRVEDVVGLLANAEPGNVAIQLAEAGEPFLIAAAACDTIVVTPPDRTPGDTLSRLAVALSTPPSSRRTDY